jgi:hypothetical protein
MTENAPGKRSLFALIADLPGFLVALAKSEIDLLKKELTDKLKHAGIGIGLVAAAATFAFFAAGVFVAAGILALAEVLPGWAAALIVGGALLVITGALGYAGVVQLKRGTPPTPTRTIASVRDDVNAITGIGKRGSS